MTRVRAAALGLVVAVLIPVPMSGTQQDADDLTRRQLEQGRSFIRTAQYSEALREFERIVSSYPSSPYADDALLEIAKYQLDINGDLTAAKTALDTLTDKYDRSDSAPMAYLLKGLTVLRRSRARNDLLQARSEFERVRSYFPRSEPVPMSMYYAGEVTRLMGEPGVALERFQDVNSTYPRSTAAALSNLSSAQCYIRLDEPVRAMEALQRVRIRFPSTTEAQTALRWNTILSRLYTRTTAQQPAFAFSGHGVAGPGGKLKDVFAIAIHENSELFVATKSAASLFSTEGAALRTVAASPRAIFFDPKGRLVVIEKGAVQVDHEKAIQLTALKPDGTARILEDVSAGAAFSTGEYLVNDEGAHTVRKFSPTGQPLGDFIAAQPERLVVNGLDEVAMLDKDARTVSVFDRNGKPLRKIGLQGPGYQLRNPTDITFDALGHLYVLDRRSGVAVFRPSGNFVVAFNIPEKVAGTIREGNALAVDAAGRLFIYDASAERIQIYQ